MIGSVVSNIHSAHLQHDDKNRGLAQLHFAGWARLLPLPGVLSCWLELGNGSSMNNSISVMFFSYLY
jgi:hypothetical protein